MAAAMARPCPVLPLVGSMIVPPGFSSPAALSGLDHRQTDAVLDRPTGIEHLHLGEEQRLPLDGTEVTRDPADPDEWRVADQIEY